jgi:chromosome partitioning protein
MIKLTVANQKGGVGKTTTTLTLAREFADRGKRVLVIDTDPQGSVSTSLHVQSPRSLYNIVVEKLDIAQVITEIHPNIHAILSTNRVARLEAVIAGETAKEMLFYSLLSTVEHDYDVVLFDVAPSISNLQSCSIAFSRNVLIPVGMDSLSIEGAIASLGTIRVLNQFLRLGCQCVGLLPTMLDQRLSITQRVLRSLEALSTEQAIPLLPGIRTDQSVNKALEACVFVQDYDPQSKALQDYRTVAELLLRTLDGQPETHPAA